MRHILAAALIVVPFGALATEADKPMCSSDGSVRFEWAKAIADYRIQQHYIVTYGGKTSEFHDAGGVGTGIPARMYADDNNRAFAIYYPETDNEVPKGAIVLGTEQGRFVLRPCPKS